MNKMILGFFMTLAMAAAFESARADFVPGRVRAGQFAEMNITESNGIYNRVSALQIFMNYMDGRSEPVSITVSDGSRATVTYPIQSVKKTSCGNHYFAAPQHQSHFRINLELVDYSHIQCRMLVRNKWHVSLSHSDAQNTSQLKAEGNPEALAVTL